jgi:flagellar basal-body rod protein FlgF
VDKLIFTALSGQAAIDQRMQQIANEVANTSTVGFKKSFASAMQSFRYEGPGFATRYVAVPSSGANIDMSPGTITTTGRNLDVSLSGKQMLAVQAADGAVAYTRRGDLKIGGDGSLQLATGEQVQSAGGGAIVPPAQAELKIGTDGTVFVLPQGDVTRTFVPFARMQIVEAPDGAVNLREDGLFKSADGAPFAAAQSPLLSTGQLEGSNSSVFSALIDMVSMSRQYEMQIKVLKQADELAERTQGLAKISG